MLVFEERGNRSTRRKSLGVENQQTRPTYDAGSGNRTQATLVGGERSHDCAIPAPQRILGEQFKTRCKSHRTHLG